MGNGMETGKKGREVEGKDGKGMGWNQEGEGKGRRGEE